MSQETTYTCDRCGAFSTDNDKLGLVRVQVGMARNLHYGSLTQSVEVESRRPLSVEWCKVCLDNVGISWPKKEGGGTEESLPTVEGLIREIVREEMGQE